MSPTVSHCLPLAATRLSLLLNPHPQELLHELDEDNDGSVSYAELAQAVKNLKKVQNRAHLKAQQAEQAGQTVGQGQGQGQEHGRGQRGRARARETPSSTAKKQTRGKPSTGKYRVGCGYC